MKNVFFVTIYMGCATIKTGGSAIELIATLIGLKWNLKVHFISFKHGMTISQLPIRNLSQSRIYFLFIPSGLSQRAIGL